jgi:hypothetical protein
MELSFFFLCVAVVAIVYIKRDKCLHTWEDKTVENTVGLGDSKYKVITQKCSKCGKNHIEKFHIN